ncbi:hypothetical protein BN946_scf185007.g83 [Trametes cinnabarina]|uniref:BTB domain-containing protein n=1 Tax=Pycnoporus cinnabarinus TaxID=5643 RepID=A0A060SLC5_PYCCI|nr:hypothetical protein BN946_scf185007.g83 [Trametes cinnabarina]
MTSAPPPATVPSPAPASPSPSPSPPLEQLPYVEGRLRFIKDSDFWFTDGNIVLMAMDFHLGASSMAFCVHRGLLSRHSDVFGLSFEAGLPNPTTADILGTVADCPIVRISDSYHDFKCFLRAVYDGYVPGDVLSFAEAAALVRTGHKYCAPLVQNVGLEILAPRNFEDLWSLVLHFREEAIEATNLFATVAPGSPAHLIAFYRCSQLEIRTILTGTRRADGFLETLSMEEIVRWVSFILGSIYRPSNDVFMQM